MTREEESSLHLFETRVRQLILRYKELEKENQELYALVQEKEEALSTSQSKCQKLQEDYDNLKLAKMIEISSQELNDAKSKVSKLIREVDKCIALINV